MRFLAAALVLAGCLDSAPSPPDIDHVAAAPPPGEKDQGRFLHGEVADARAVGGYHVHTAREPSFVPPGRPAITRIDAASGILTAYDGSTQQFSGADPRFAGIELPIVGSTSTLRIVSVGPSPTARYVLHIVDEKGIATPYCSDGGGAFASPGRWTTTGVHEEASTLNFTCSDGVILKCFTWGYDPGTYSNKNVPEQDDPWRVHQACTRMARADRCGNGISATMDETSIVIRDRVVGAMPNIDDPSVPPLRISTQDPPTMNAYWFEAAWTKDRAICLTEERWKSMPIDEDACLPDPRTDSSVPTCDQIGIDALISQATFFNSSKVGQLYLNRWTRGTDQMVSVRGFPGENGNERPPFHVNSGYVFEGQIGLLMRNPPGSLDLPGTAEPDLAMVSLYRLGSDNVLSLKPPTPSHVLVGPEGYVYTERYVTEENPEGTYLPLYLYQSGSDYVTSTEPPAGTGWSQVGSKPIGYVDVL